MLSLKSALGKLVGFAENPVTPTGFYYGNCPTHMAKTTGTYYTPSTWTNQTYTHLINDTNFFEADSNGFKVLKTGNYFYTTSCHMNSNGSTTMSLATNMRVYTNGTGADISNSRRYLLLVSQGYGPLSTNGVTHLNAGQIIAPVFGRYSGTATEFKPSIIYYTLMYLGER